MSTHIFVVPDAGSDLVLLSHQLRTSLFPFLVRIRYSGVSEAAQLLVEVSVPASDAAQVARLLSVASQIEGAKCSLARKVHIERMASSIDLGDGVGVGLGEPSAKLRLNSPRAFPKERITSLLNFYHGVNFDASDHTSVSFVDALAASMALEDLRAHTNFKVVFEQLETDVDVGTVSDSTLTAIHIRNVPPSTDLEFHIGNREKCLWGRMGVPASMHDLLARCSGFQRIIYQSKDVYGVFDGAQLAQRAFKRLSATCPKFTITLCKPPASEVLSSAKSAAALSATPYVSLRISPPGINPLDVRGLVARTPPSSFLKNIYISSKKTTAVLEFSSAEKAAEYIDLIRKSTNLVVEFSETATGPAPIPVPEPSSVESVVEEKKIEKKKTKSSADLKKKASKAVVTNQVDASASNAKVDLKVSKIPKESNAAVVPTIITPSATDSNSQPKTEASWTPTQPKTDLPPSRPVSPAVHVNSTGMKVTKVAKIPKSATTALKPSTPAASNQTTGTETQNSTSSKGNRTASPLPKSQTWVPAEPKAELPAARSASPVASVTKTPKTPATGSTKSVTSKPAKTDLKASLDPQKTVAQNRSSTPDSIGKQLSESSSKSFHGFTVNNPPSGINIHPLAITQAGFSRLVYNLSTDSSTFTVSVLFNSENNASASLALFRKLFSPAVVTDIVPRLMTYDAVAGTQNDKAPANATVIKVKTVSEKPSKSVLVTAERWEELVRALDGYEGVFVAKLTAFVKFSGGKEAKAAYDLLSSTTNFVPVWSSVSEFDNAVKMTNVNSLKKAKSFDVSGKPTSSVVTTAGALPPADSPPEPIVTAASAKDTPTNVLRILRVRGKELIPWGRAREAAKMCQGCLDAFETIKVCYAKFDSKENAYAARLRMIKTLKFEIDYTVEQYLIDAKAAAGYVTTDTGSSGGSQNGERSKFVKKAHSSAADLGNHMNQHPQHEKVEQYDQRPHSSYQAQNNNSSQNSSRQQRPNSSVPYKHGNTYPARSRNTWTPAESSPGWNEDEGVPKPTAHKPLAKRGGVLEGGPDDEDDVPETTSHPSTAGAAQRVSRDYYGSKSAAVSAAAPPAGLVDKEWGATANAPSNYGGQQPPPTTHNQYQNQYSRNYANQAPVNSAKSYQQDSRGGDGGRAVYQNQPAGFGSPTSNLKSTGYNGAPASRGGISASRGGRGRGDFYGGGGRGGYNHGGNYSGGMAGRGGFQRGASSQQEEWGQEMKLPQNETGGYSRN